MLVIQSFENPAVIFTDVNVVLYKLAYVHFISISVTTVLPCISVLYWLQRVVVWCFVHVLLTNILQFFSIDLTHFSKLRTLFSKQWAKHFVIILNRLYVFIHFIQITNHANNFLKTLCRKLSDVFTIVNTTNQYFNISEEKRFYTNHKHLCNVCPKHNKQNSVICHSIKWTWYIFDWP